MQALINDCFENLCSEHIKAMTFSAVIASSCGRDHESMPPASRLASLRCNKFWRNEEGKPV
jgi:hypothetical protein